MKLAIGASVTLIVGMCVAVAIIATQDILGWYKASLILINVGFGLIGVAGVIALYTDYKESSK